jgi:hypothetical protein
MKNSFTLFAKEKYIEYSPGDVDRNMTIAAFYVSQGGKAKDYNDNMHLNYQPMRRDVLRFLMSDSAVNYWLREKRLVISPQNASWLQLTAKGMNEISASFTDTQKKNRADEAGVEAWIQSMWAGGGETDQSKEFIGELRLNIDEGGRRTQEQATRLMSDYYQANKNILPASIKHKREEIIALIMDGVSAEEAFFQASGA